MNNTKITTDPLGLPIYSSKHILEMLYNGQKDLLSQVYADPTDPEIQKFNQSAVEQGTAPLNLYQDLNISKEEFDKICQADWLMPDEYKNLDIEQWIKDQGPPWEPEATRIEEELAAFKEHNMINLLRWLKYFVDTCRANNVVWGVGRGSSVASYVLYLIGVHKIDSIKYNLDWREFLR